VSGYAGGAREGNWVRNGKTSQPVSAECGKYGRTRSIGGVTLKIGSQHGSVSCLWFAWVMALWVQSKCEAPRSLIGINVRPSCGQGKDVAKRDYFDVAMRFSHGLSPGT